MPEEQRKIKKYKVLQGSQSKLARKVQKHLNKGWEVQGSVSVTGGFLMTGKTYAQAVVLYEKDS
ncbi:MAG: DUF1737 domain-containing protein [Candidatus Saccharibacteria bacterium]